MLLTMSGITQKVQQKALLSRARTSTRYHIVTTIVTAIVTNIVTTTEEGKRGLSTPDHAVLAQMMEMKLIFQTAFQRKLSPMFFKDARRIAPSYYPRRLKVIRACTPYRDNNT